MLKGTIMEDSPAVWGLFLRTFHSHECEELSYLYQKIYKLRNDGDFEPELKRDHEVRFNPKPARVASLAISEAGIEDFAYIKATLLLCLDNEEEARQVNADEHVRTILKFPFKIINQFREAALVGATEWIEQANVSDSVNTNALRICVCIVLDIMRHLHMNTTVDKFSTVQRGIGFLTFLTERPDVHCPALTKLHASVSRWRKLQDAG